MLKNAVALLVIMNLFAFCKSSKYAEIPRPPEQYGLREEAPLVSTITIPVNISTDDLVNMLNKRLEGPLYEDYSYRDNGGDDLMMKAVKSQNITLNISGNTIKYRIPLKLWFKKNLYVADAEAEGELALAFKTTFAINDDWTLRSETLVEYHEWLSKPVLKTGIGNVNIESVANIFLNRNKRTLSQTIDRLVSQQLNLRPFVQDAWNALQEPTLLSEEYRLWVKTTPISIGMTPITTDWHSINAKIAVETLNDVTFGEKPDFRPNSNLPNLKHILDAPEDFRMRFMTTVPFPEAERLARSMLVGQEFESGKKKVRVEDLRLWGNNDKLVVDTRLSGAYSGNVYFIGRPVFNAAHNQVEVTDLDFHADTKNMLHQSAAWLFSGPIRKKIRDAMVFPIHENLDQLKMSIQSSLSRYEIREGVVLSGAIDSLAVEDTHVTPGGIRVDLYSKGQLRVNVKGIR